MKLANYVIAGIIGISSSVNAKDLIRTRYVTIPVENRLPSSTPDLYDMIREAEVASEIIPDKLQRVLRKANAKIVLITDFASQPEYTEQDGTFRGFVNKVTREDTLYELHIWNPNGTNVYDKRNNLDPECESATYIPIISRQTLQEDLLHGLGHSTDIIIGNEIYGMFLSKTNSFRYAFEREIEGIRMTEGESVCDPECDIGEWFAQSFSKFYIGDANFKNSFPLTHRFHTRVLVWFGIDSLDNK